MDNFVLRRACAHADRVLQLAIALRSAGTGPNGAVFTHHIRNLPAGRGGGGGGGGVKNLISPGVRFVLVVVAWRMVSCSLRAG